MTLPFPSYLCDRKRALCLPAAVAGDLDAASTCHVNYPCKGNDISQGAQKLAAAKKPVCSTLTVVLFPRDFLH